MYALENTETWFRIYYPGNSPMNLSLNCSIMTIWKVRKTLYMKHLVTTYGATQASLNTINTNPLFAQDDARRFQGKWAIWKYRGKDALGLVQRTATERDANWIVTGMPISFL
jgi:hypothetical protein